MLNRLIHTHQAIFGELAHNWLALGAARFAVGNESGTLQEWRGAEKQKGGLYLRQQVSDGELTAGYLEVEGVVDGDLAGRLLSEARFTSKWLELELELQTRSKELSHFQDRFSLLANLSRMTRTQIRPEEVIHSYLKTANQLLGTCAAALIENNAGVITVRESEPDNHLLARDGFAVLRKMFAAGDIAFDNQGRRVKGWQNFLFIPVESRSAHPTALLFLNRQTDRFDPQAVQQIITLVDFLESDLERLHHVGEHMTDTRRQTEAAVARQVQAHHPPRKIPQLSSLDIYAAHWPGREVGGAFYDFSDPDNDHLYITSGNISGKGVPSALLLSNIQATLRTFFRLNEIRDVGGMLKGVQRGIQEDLTEHQITATLFVGRYIPGKREFEYISAGHAPLIYCPAGGSARFLPPQGPALGCLSRSTAGPGTLPMNTGDLLLVWGDSPNPAGGDRGDWFDCDETLSLVTENQTMGAKELAHKLHTEVNGRQNGFEQEYARTLVAIKGVL